MTISIIISKRIREIIKAKGYSQYKLEMMSGISHSTMACLLNNRYESLNLKTLFLILQGLEISVLEFFDSPLFDLTNLEID